MLERFRSGAAPVFLISLKAGGFGLNLTEADYCFLLDPWWNPATEAQAVDRTHRIGQTRNVMVYRLIARDTIEEKVMALKARKAAAVLQRHGRGRRVQHQPHGRGHQRTRRLTSTFRAGLRSGVLSGFCPDGLWSRRTGQAVFEYLSVSLPSV